MTAKPLISPTILDRARDLYRDLQDGIAFTNRLTDEEREQAQGELDDAFDLIDPILDVLTGRDTERAEA